MKTIETISTFSEVSLEEETIDHSHVASFMELTVADEDGQDEIVSVLPIDQHDIRSPTGGKIRDRRDSNESGFSLILRPNLDRDVSGLTECVFPPSPAMRTSSIPQSPALGHSSDVHQRPKGVQRHDSGFDLVVSNHSIPMSTLTMLEFPETGSGGSPANKPHEFGTDVQKKWLSTTLRNVDTPILEDTNEDNFGGDGSQSPISSSPRVSLTMQRESRDSTKQTGTSLKSEPKEIKKKTSTKSKVDTRKYTSGKGKVAKPRVVKKENSFHSTESKSSSRRSSASKRTSAKRNVIACSQLRKENSFHSTESKSSRRRRSANKRTTAKQNAMACLDLQHYISKSKPSKNKSKKSTSITKSPIRKKEERDQPISPKNGTTKDSKRDDPNSRKSKSKESRQDAAVTRKLKRSSEKRASVSPKTRNSSISPTTTSKHAGTRRSPKTKATSPGKTAIRRVSDGKKSSRDPPGTVVHRPSLMINNRQVPAIPIKPTIVETPQTRDSSTYSQNDSMWWSLNNTATKSRISTMEPKSVGKNAISPLDVRKSPSFFGRMRRSTIKGRAR